MTIAEAADRVRCCERTVRRAIDSGALRAGRIGGARGSRGGYRIRPDDPERWVYGDASQARRSHGRLPLACARRRLGVADLVGALADRGGRRVRRSFATREEAHLARARIALELSRNGVPEPVTATARAR